MIDVALSIVVNRLNQQLMASGVTDEAVVLLADSVSIGSEPEGQNKLLVLISNIAEDTVSAGMRRPVSGPHWHPGKPVTLILQVVVAASFEPTRISRGLRVLSSALSFFRANPVFDRNNTPDMGATGIEKLSVEMENLDIDAISQLWRVQGGRYLPSVVYRLRIGYINPDTVIGDTPSIHSTLN